MKKYFLIIACFGLLQAHAQIKQVTLQASGLTCALCSNAIYKSLQKLSFAEKVESNIKESSFTINFRQGSVVDFDVIRKAVEAAGFSVSKFEVKANFSNIAISNDAHISMLDKNLHFLNVKNQKLNGEQTLQVVDKKFVSDNVYKKYAATTSFQCIKTGMMAPCCSKDNSHAGTRIYHVTI